MGCVGPKSAIEVRDGMTFLDLSVRQIEVRKKTMEQAFALLYYYWAILVPLFFLSFMLSVHGRAHTKKL